MARRKGYSRRVVLRSSVNVIANPVRVAPIPKVIAHVPTNIIITTSGVGLSLIKVAMPNAVQYRSTSPHRSEVFVAGSAQTPPGRCSSHSRPPG